MPSDNNVDYMPNQPFNNSEIDPSDSQHRSFQKHKWQILAGVFLLILIISNIVIWSQSPTYQSQSILHFSYTSQTELEFGELAQRQISVHKKRLKSNNVLSLVVEELKEDQRLIINVQSLFESLSAQASMTGRIITLTANGNELQILKPILDAWVKVYLNLITSESLVNKQNKLLVADQQSQLLELKITEQKQQLEIFADENNITSLERDENRALSQTKNLGANLDQALADKVQAQALLDSLNVFINNGQAIIRPDDKSQIDAIKFNLQEHNANLSALSDKYTQTFLELDPNIVTLQKKQLQLKQPFWP